jgi:hypothetical protein
MLIPFIIVLGMAAGWVSQLSLGRKPNSDRPGSRGPSEGGRISRRRSWARPGDGANSSGAEPEPWPSASG